MPEAGNGKSNRTRDVIQTALLIIVLLFIVIDRIVVPQVAVTKSAETITQEAARLGQSLAIERRLTALETNYANIDKKLDGISDQLRAHMEKGK